jgi:hypothetical protein
MKVNATVVIHQTMDIPMEFGPKGESLGMWLDQYIEDAVKEGTDIRDISLSFTDDEWAKVAEEYGPTKVEENEYAGVAETYASQMMASDIVRGKRSK